VSTSVFHISSLNQPAPGLNTSARKPMQTERKFSSNRPIDVVCERIMSVIEQGWAYRSVLSEYELRVEALWGAVTWGVQRMRAENRQLRARVRQLEQALARAGVVTAAVMMPLAVSDLWQRTGDPIQIERGFRKMGRSRRRGLEDSTRAQEYVVMTPIAA
jgi:hypothetical protein